MTRPPWFVRWWPWVPTRWFMEQRETIARHEDALRLIAGDRCSTFTRGRCSDRWSGRQRHGKYGADKWCDACIAHDALVGAA